MWSVHIEGEPDSTQCVLISRFRLAVCQEGLPTCLTDGLGSMCVWLHGLLSLLTQSVTALFMWTAALHYSIVSPGLSWAPIHPPPPQHTPLSTPTSLSFSLSSHPSVSICLYLSQVCTTEPFRSLSKHRALMSHIKFLLSLFLSALRIAPCQLHNVWNI